MSFIVDEYDKEYPQLRIRFEEREISFAVRNVAPEAREWLGGVLESQINELVKLRVRQALEKHKAELRKLLGVQDVR